MMTIRFGYNVKKLEIFTMNERLKGKRGHKKMRSNIYGQEEKIYIYLTFRFWL